MSPWLIAVIAGLLIALVQYGRRDWRSAPILLSALLRFAAITLVVALLLDAPAARAKPVSSWAALDVSASMARDDSTTWKAARDTIAAFHPESLLTFGDSARRADLTRGPSDAASLLRPAVERTLGAGHPLLVVTDGELDDPEAARQLPAGSRIVVLPHTKRRDLAVSAIDAPRAAVSGDTIDARITVVAGGAGAAKSTLSLTLDDKQVATASVDSLGPFAEHTIDIKAKLDAPAGPAVLRAIAKSPGDAEPRNDTLAAALDLSRAATAVFVSTSPDFDARFALTVLRGALGIPTRGFFRVAPGQWRVDGPLTPISESDVKQALKDAPVAIIHGDTAVFGPPRNFTIGPLALVITSGTDGEWYASSAPASPLAPALTGVLWDSLPPVSIATTTPAGAWQGVVARLGRGQEQKPIVVGSDEPRRVAIVAASGMWRWRFRGGVSSDAFTALWGGIFDWLAAERADRRAAVPDERLLRAGDPVRWRRGSPEDSVVPITLRRRGGAGVDSLTLRFPPDANVVETAALAPGIYEVSTKGGNALLAVNPSREWLPRPARVASGVVRGAVSVNTPPRLRDAGWGWPYVLAVLLLCAEWILRRRRGMR